MSTQKIALNNVKQEKKTLLKFVAIGNRGQNAVWPQLNQNKGRTAVNRAGLGCTQGEGKLSPTNMASDSLYKLEGSTYQ